MPQEKRDYYEILMIVRTASTEEIKKAYRKRALEFHPDRNPGDKKAEDKFKEATEAYQILSDAQKKQAYDAYGHVGLSGAGGGSGFSSAGFGDVFEGIFEGFFGDGRQGARKAQRGSDLQYDLEISFEEAAFGAEKSVEIDREEACSNCRGEGTRPGTQATTCATCRGAGQVMASSGFFSVSRPCPKCRGRGSWIEHPCDACSGDGRVAATRKLQVKVPAGVDNGLRLRMNGEGEAGTLGGPRGDLYIDIHVHTHEIFTREGDNVLCEVPVSFVQAALGGEIEVPTLTGVTTLKIPAGTQSGRVFKLKGKGIVSLRGQREIGDEEIRVAVETPTHLSDKQKDLLKQFAALSGEKVNPLSSSFVDRMKKLFSK
jgi:molecular chaperone DnaJ